MCGLDCAAALGFWGGRPRILYVFLSSIAGGGRSSARPESCAPAVTLVTTRIQNPVSASAPQDRINRRYAIASDAAQPATQCLRRRPIPASKSLKMNVGLGCVRSEVFGQMVLSYRADPRQLTQVLDFAISAPIPLKKLISLIPYRINGRSLAWMSKNSGARLACFQRRNATRGDGRCNTVLHS